MTVKLFIFDLGNVTLFFSHQIIVRKFSKLSGIGKDEIYNFMFDAKFINLFEKGLITEKEFYKKVCKKLNIRISFAEFKKIFCNIFKPNKSLFPVLKTLKKKYKICAFSNTDKTHFEYIMEKYPVMKLFDSYYLSYKLHSMKPEPKMFETLLNREKVKPEECIYADDIGRYIQAAKKLGFNAIQFKSTNQYIKSLKNLGISI